MVLLRRVIGDALRARRQGQHRTLREVSTAANVSLGYLSEIERGQKEASSELLSAICDALGAQLSELLREVSDTLSLAEEMEGVLVPVAVPDSRKPAAEPETVPAAPEAALRPLGASVGAEARPMATDGTVSVSVHQETPLKATLRATRSVLAVPRDRDVVCAA
ncbi:helix-turn-helix transcriptional regulator [Actinomycetes bacterium KLBMP 9797]